MTKAARPFFRQRGVLGKAVGVTCLRGGFSAEDVKVQVRHPRTPSDRVGRRADGLLEVTADEGELALCQTRQGRSVVGVAQPVVLAEGPDHDGEGAVTQFGPRLLVAAQGLDDRLQPKGPADRSGSLLRESILEVLPQAPAGPDLVPAGEAKPAVGEQG